MKTRYVLLALLPILILTLIAGCDSASNPIAPTGSVISVSASPTKIALDGQSSTINISGFRPDGNPLNPRTQLTLSSTIGVLRTGNTASAPVANVIEVDDSGRALIYLFGDGRQGMATVTVSLTTGGENTSATVDVQVGDDASSQPTVTVDANPRDLPVGGTSQITVTAKNADGSPLTSGTVVLRTTLGTLGSTSLQLSSGNNGVVTTTLTSSQSGAATVTASVGSSAEETVEVTFGTTRMPTLIISANPSTIDPNEEAEVTLTVRDEANNLFTTSETVFLDVDAGSLSSSSGGSGSSNLSVSIRGRGRVFYRGNTDVTGTVTISGFVLNSETATETITIRNTPATVTLEADDTEIDNRANPGEIALTVRVLDSEGLGIQGAFVVFDIRNITATGSGNVVPGLFTPQGGSQTDNNGVAMSTLSFAGTIGNDVTQFQVFATVRGVEAPPLTIRVTGTAP